MAVKYEVVAADTASTITELHGWSVEEAAGTPAAASLFLRKTNASGDKVIRINLTADETDTVTLKEPIDFGAPVFFDLVTGTAEITIWGR